MHASINLSITYIGLTYRELNLSVSKFFELLTHSGMGIGLCSVSLVFNCIAFCLIGDVACIGTSLGFSAVKGK